MPQRGAVARARGAPGAPPQGPVALGALPGREPVGRVRPGAPQAGGAVAMPAPPGVDATAWAAAQEACAQYAPTPPTS